MKLEEQKRKEVFNNIVEVKLNRTTATKLMKPTNLNAYATNFSLDTSFVWRENTTNDSQEENIVAYCVNRELIDANTRPGWPKSLTVGAW